MMISCHYDSPAASFVELSKRHKELVLASAQAKDHLKEASSLCEDCASSKGSGEGLRKLALTVRALLDGVIERLEKATESASSGSSIAIEGKQESEGTNGVNGMDARKHFTQDSIIAELNSKYLQIIKTRKENEEKWKTMADKITDDLQKCQAKLQSAKHDLKMEKKTTATIRADNLNLIHSLREKERKEKENAKKMKTTLEDVAKTKNQISFMKRRLEIIEDGKRRVESENSKLNSRLERAKKKYSELRAAASEIQKSYEAACETLNELQEG